MSQLEKAFDIKQFREWGHELVDLLANQYLNSQNNPNKLTHWHEPQEELDFWSKFEMKDDSPFSMVKNVLERTNNLHSPHYIGHQVSSPVPATSLMNFLQGYMNNGTATYEMGAAGIAMEKLIAQLVIEKIGWSEDADGFLTSGGTLANLTALLTARSVQLEESVWEDGMSQKLGIIVCEEAHYCVDRAAKIMGLGNDGVIKIPSNEKYQMDISQLEKYYNEATAKGIKVFAIVGSACSTSTGAYDDLVAIGDFAKKNNLWFHIDGAHGGAVCFTSKYKERLKGIENADSFVLDWHKMLLTPNLVTSLIYKKGIHADQTFLPKAQYLWEHNEGGEWHQMGKRTFECTKSILAYRVFFLWKMYGTELFEEFVTKMYDLGNTFYEMLQNDNRYISAYRPESNILCFQLQSPDEKVMSNSDFNAEIRKRLLHQAQFYIVMTRLRGENYLRVTIINPKTTTTHLASLLEYVAELGQEVLT